ncbi:MAG: hypothetical protein PHQ23_16900, partial [Candidatus Wallbacteria bacterium]|nr:hypothetical protein [Candidatus Wallbacteria bacterium]
SAALKSIATTSHGGVNPSANLKSSFSFMTSDSNIYPLVSAKSHVFAENAAFCDRYILAQEGKLPHIVHIRYGGGCGGGGKSTGIWLLNILKKLQCEVFVTDSHYARQSGDERVYELYPRLAGSESTELLKQFRIVHSEGWSSHGDVSWSLVE